MELRETIFVANSTTKKTARQMSRAFGKNVRLFAYHDNPEDMLKSMIPSIKNLELGKENVSLSVPSSDRVSVIGRNGRNIKAIKEIMSRHFSIKNVRLR